MLRQNVHTDGGYGKVIYQNDTHSVTENVVWCHHTKTIEEEKAKYPKKKVVYAPDVKLFIRSSIEKNSSKLCIVVTSSNELIPKELKSSCQYLTTKGFSIKKLDPSTVDKRRLLRAYKESSLVILYKSNSHFEQISLCGSGTPFVLVDCQVQDTVFEFLSFANLKDVVTTTNNVSSKIKEVEKNSATFSSLIEKTLQLLEKYYFWKDKSSDNNQPSDKDFQENCMFSPWVGTINNVDTMRLDTFNASLLFCKEIKTSNIFVLKKAKEMRLNATYDWNGQILFVGKGDVIVRMNINNLKGVKENKLNIVGDEVIIPIKYEVDYKIPKLVPEDYCIEEYPLTYKKSIPLPSEISKYVTKEKVNKAVTFL